MAEKPRTGLRVVFALGAALAFLAAVLYVVPGDLANSNDPSELDRNISRGLAHALSAALIGVSLLIAAIRGAWGRASTILVVIAGVLFAYHLYAAYFWGGAWPW